MKTLFIIFIVITVLVCLFNVYSNKYINPFDISMYFAPPGTGKSVFLNKLAHKYKKMGWSVYTLDANIDGELLGINDIYTKQWDKTAKNLLLIDEASIVYNSRAYKTNFNHDRLRWWKLHRHYHIKVIMASQDYEDVDKILRKLTTNYYLLSRFCNLWVLARKVKKGIVLTVPVGEQSGTFADGYSFENPLNRGAIQFAYLPYWVKKFDSFST